MNYDKFKVSFVTMESRASKTFNDENEAFDFVKRIKSKVENIKIVGIKDGIKNELDLSGKEKKTDAKTEKKKTDKKNKVVKKLAKKINAKKDDSAFMEKMDGKNKVVNLTISDVGWISNAIRYTLDFYRPNLFDSQLNDLQKNLNSIFKTIQGGGTFQFTPDEVNRIFICLNKYYNEIKQTNPSKAPRVESLRKFFLDLKNEDSKSLPS